MNKHFLSALAASLLITFATALPARAAVWTNADDRDYDNNGNLISTAWSTEADPAHGHVGNWSGGPYPGHDGVVDAYLGAPGNTICDGLTLTLNSLTIASGGALFITASDGLTVTTTTIATDGALGFIFSGGGNPYYTNAGTFRKSAGTGSYALFSGNGQNLNLAFNSLPGSVITVDSGSLLLSGAGGLLDTVKFNVAAGALVDLVDASSGGNNTFQGTLSSGTALGTVRLSAGTMAGTYNNGPSCTLALAGNLFQWTGGTIGTYQQGAHFINTGTVNVSGSGVKTNQSFFTNKQMVIQTGTGRLITGNFGGGGSFTNAAGAVYDLRSDSGLDSQYPESGFFNAGLLKKSAGTGISTFTAPVTLTGGTIEVDSGTLQLANSESFDGGKSTGGTFVVAANTLIDLGTRGHYTGTYTGSGAGTVRFSAGELNGNYRAGDSQTIFNFPAGLFQWTGGLIGEFYTEVFVNQGTITLSGSALKEFACNFTTSGTVIQTGTGDLADNLHYHSFLTIAAGGLYDLRSDAGIEGNEDTNVPFTNAGTFQKSGGTGTSTIAPAFINTGTVLADTGTMAFTGHFTQTAGVINLNGGKLSSAMDIQLNGGSIEGSGTITGNVVNNSGIVAPGHSPGTITISGDYTQGADASLDMQIGGAVAGTGYDRLIVKGTANLGGKLNISLINGFKPTAGDVYTLLSAGSFNGAFSKVTASGFTGKIDTSSNGVALTITTVSKQLLNISTRLKVLTGDNVLIGGFIITGTQPKQVVLRAIGPSLTKAGVAGALADPVLELHKPDGSVTTNDNWKSSQQAAIVATGVAPTNDLESAIVATLAPGSYTAVVTGKNNGTGIGLIEAYDLTPTSGELANIATRGFVDTGENVLIGGYIVGGGSAGTTANVLIRAIGPSLAKAGIAGALADPTLELHDGNGNILRSNDDWKSTQQAAIIATGVPPTNDKESALIATLTPGNYTAIVRGKSNTKGVGLVEVYHLP